MITTFQVRLGTVSLTQEVTGVKPREGQLTLIKNLGPVHMAVGDPGKVRYPIYPGSEKTGLHMQPRGAGVRFKKLSCGR